jgi:hypothetical protein
MGEALNIEIPLHWVTVPARGCQFAWHNSLPKSVSAREAISGPRVYRWTLRAIDGKIAFVYIGQSERFQERVSAYRSGKKTSHEPNDTVRSKIRDWENSGGTVELQFLDFDVDPFSINGKPVTVASLSDHDTRLMMESVAIFSARASNLNVLNQLQENVHVKEIRRIVKDPELLKRVLSILQTKPDGV